MGVPDAGLVVEEAAASAAVSSNSCAVGSFDPSPIERLVQLLEERDEAELKRRLRNEFGIEDDSFASALRKSFAICCRGCLLYPATSELAVSFNGGKDACVVLYLWLAALRASLTAGAKPPQAIFFDSSDEFPSIQSFVNWVAYSLDLRMVTIQQRSFRQGMEDLVAHGVRAVVMGQRHGDPWMANVDAFSPSSDGWPPFMRINPIIDWSYSHVWTFLRCFGLPYCSLYDQGYTSLGSVRDTLLNPALQRRDGSYAPAHELRDPALERAGRTSGSNGAKEDAGERLQRSSSRLPRTAGIVVIGNEILNGKVHDTNAKYLCEELHGRGVAVTCIEVVPDEVAAIAASVRRVSEACELAFTSGGLGPTHDDLTMAGVAAAFGRPLVEDGALLAMLRRRAGGVDGMAPDEGRPFRRQSSEEAGHHKMAQVPEGSTVEWPPDGNPWPLVSMRNVYIFAGMPRVFRAMFERAAADGRFNSTQRWTSCVLHLDADELDIVAPLSGTVNRFPKVSIGSYPSTDQREQEPSRWRCRLSITFESFDAEQVHAAREHLVAGLPASLLLTEAQEVTTGMPG